LGYGKRNNIGVFEVSIHDKFKAYCEELGKPELECKFSSVLSDWVKDEKPRWYSDVDYRIAGDRHWELRLKWINSDKTLPIEILAGNGEWMLHDSPTWSENFEYKEAQALTAPNPGNNSMEYFQEVWMNDKTDPGAHYRHNLRVKVTQEDLERGYVDVQLDPYRIALVYNMTDHMEFFILKKNLRMGSAHKNKKQELLDIIDAANRRLEILDEDMDEVRT
jgi:hypothetical protein